MQKSLTPYFLGALLLTLMTGIIILGVFAYRNISEISRSLVEESNPNLNLVHLHSISAEFRQMDAHLEAFVFSEQQVHRDRFEASTSRILAETDSLKMSSRNETVRQLLDSLSELVMAKANLLIQVSKLDYVRMEDQFAKLQAEMMQLKKERPNEDTVQRKKRNFLQRIFQKQPQVDSQQLLESVKWQELMNAQLNEMARSARQENYTLKLKEYALQQDHAKVQQQISRVLERLENHELNRIRLQASLAAKQTREVGKWITYFGVLACLLVIIALVALIIYVLRTRKYQEALHLAHNSAIKVANEKEQFLMTMSHELRTPMNAIIGFTRFLKRTSLNAEQREQIEIIDNSAGHLLFLLNDVLDYSKMKTGKIRFEAAPFSVNQVVEDCRHLLESKMEEKQLAFSYASNEDPTVVGDANRLKQVLLNLLYNAVKFTNEGSITVRAVWKKQAESAILLLEVEDTGIGIARHRKAKIFEEFTQLEEGTAEGTGLGLAITKRLVEAQGGSIKVTSKVGKGSCFKVRIPYQLSDEKVCTTTQVVNHTSGNLQGKVVLIADDELYNRKLLMKWCEQLQAKCKVAVDGEEARALMEKETFDLVLLDFRMPRLGGLELITQYSELMQRQGLVVGLTASIVEEDAQIARQHKVPVLLKPFEWKSLEELLEAAGILSSEETPLYSLSGLQQMGSAAFVREMVETFVSGSEENLTQLRQAFANEDWKTCGEILHKIIAPSRHFEAVWLVDLLKKYEKHCLNGGQLRAEEVEHIIENVAKLNHALNEHLQTTTSE